jgi:hypothetical protein
MVSKEVLTDYIQAILWNKAQTCDKKIATPSQPTSAFLVKDQIETAHQHS